MDAILPRVAVLGAICWALAATTAGAQETYYLWAGASLSTAAPPAAATTASISVRIPNGEDLLLATFTSPPLDHAITLGEATGVVFLGTGRPGMDGCARVTMSLSRLTGAAQAAVASAAQVTTIHPRRRVDAPIAIPLAVTDPLLASVGDRLVFEVRVGNQCGGERNVSILYGSVGRASRVEVLPSGVTTTSTTTSTTTTTLPPSCLGTTTGLPAVRCRLEAMDAIVRSTSPASLGGARFRRRLERRIDRGLTYVRAAELIAPSRRRLARARRQLVRFARLIARGEGDGRVATEPGAVLDALAREGTTELDAMLAGPR